MTQDPVNPKVFRDTAAGFASGNPILPEGSTGVETDTGKLKHGNGSNAWNSLFYSGYPVGGFHMFVLNAAAEYDATPADEVLMMTADGNPEVSLPVTGLFIGQVIKVINGVTDGGDVSVAAVDASSVFNGSVGPNTGEDLLHPGNAATFQWDGLNWWVVER